MDNFCTRNTVLRRARPFKVRSKRRATVLFGSIILCFQQIAFKGVAGEPTGKNGEDDDATCANNGGAGCRSTTTQPRWRFDHYPNREGVSKREYVGNLVKAEFAAAGYAEPVKDNAWDVLFTQTPTNKALAFARIGPKDAGSRLVSHCRYFLAAGDKCRLGVHLAAVDKALKRDGATKQHLRTFDLSDFAEQDEWRDAVDEGRARSLNWIAKPCLGKDLAGVHVIRHTDYENIDHTANEGEGIVQQYVDKPLQVWGARKTQLHFLILATRWKPVGALFFDSGIVFRGPKGYNKNKPKNKHLISVTSPRPGVDVLPVAELWDELGEDKSSLAKARITGLLSELFGEALEETFGSFQTVANRRSYNCFDIFSVDMVLNEDLVPYILEVNGMPDLKTEFRSKTPVMGPFLRQVAEWAGERSRHGRDIPLEEELKIENKILSGFTRIV